MAEQVTVSGRAVQWNDQGIMIGLADDPDRTVWFNYRQISEHDFDPENLTEDEQVEFTIPKWYAKQKGVAV